MREETAQMAQLSAQVTAAVTVAGAAAKTVQDLELGALAEKSWEKTPKATKAVLAGAGSLITLLFGGLCVLGAWCASEIMDKADKLLKGQDRIQFLERAHKDMEKSVDTHQTAVNRRLDVVGIKLDRILLQNPIPKSRP